MEEELEEKKIVDEFHNTLNFDDDDLESGSSGDKSTEVKIENNSIIK